MRKRVIIVGGVAGGASAAARLRRLNEEMEIIMVEKGEYISYANCGLPYYLGGVIRDRDRLFVQTPEGMKARYNIQVRTGQEVVKVNREKQEVEIRPVNTEEPYRLGYDLLLLAPGALPVKPMIPGAEGNKVFTLRNVHDTDRIKNFISAFSHKSERAQECPQKEIKPASALVVGAGFIGLEMVENLHEAGLSVSLVEMADWALPKNLDYEMAALLHQQLRAEGVSLYLSTALLRIEEDSNGTWGVLSNGLRIPADLVILAVGVVPDTSLAKEAGLEIGETGGIKVNEFFQTSDPHIYAVGDAIEVENSITGQPALLPLAGPANRQARLAADAMAGRSVKYEGVIGTSVAKVFAMTAGSVGLTEEDLRRKKAPYFSSITHSSSNATYYPGSSPLTIKLNFAPDGKILGAQVVGYKGVDKRLDVLATTIKLGGKVNSLTELELAYAPPYSSAKDPVNIAGYVAGNILSQDVEVYQWYDLPHRDRTNSILLDVRQGVERQAGFIADSWHIPLPELRERISELPKDKEIIIYCQVGLRAYIATRILKQNGFKVKNLSGGYRIWQVVAEEQNHCRPGQSNQLANESL